MRTLLLMKKENWMSYERDILIFCPFCKEISDMRNIEDYIDDNCLI